MISLIVFTVSSTTYDSNRSQFRKGTYLALYSFQLILWREVELLKFFNAGKFYF